MQKLIKNKLDQLKYFTNILDIKEIRSSIVLFGLMFTVMLFEILILQSILNILNFFSQNNYNFNYLNNLVINYLNFFFNKEISILFIFALLYLIKSFLIIYVSKKEKKYLNSLRANVSNKLFSGYISMPLIFKLRVNTSDLIKNIINEVDFFTSTIYSLCVIAMDVLIFFGIAIFLLSYNFKISLVAIILFLSATILFNIFNKKKISKLGARRSFHLEKRVELIIEALSGIKDIKIFGLFDKTKENFEYHNNQVSKIAYVSQFRESLSKPFFELFIVSLIFLFILYSNTNLTNFSNYVPTIGVFLAASYRLIPSLTRISNSIQRLYYNFPSISKINDDFIKFKYNNDYKKQNENLSIKFENNCHFQNVYFSYKLKPKVEEDFILKNLNFKLIKGQKVGISGKSGIGKSTFLDLFLGFYEPYKGQISIDNINLLRCKKNWQNIITCVPQEISIKSDTLLNNITFGSKPVDKNIISKIIEDIGLKELVDSMEYGLNTIIGEKGFKLSPGQKQRLAIGRALYFNPKVLVLDESTSSLDSYNEKNILEKILIEKNNITILWVSHKKELFKKFDENYELKDGGLIRL